MNCPCIGLAALLTAAASSPLAAQVVSVIDRSGISTAGQMYIQDVQTGVATLILDPFTRPEFTTLGTGLRGLAADTQRKLIWTFSVSTTTNLYSIDYTDPDNLVINAGPRLLRPGVAAGTTPDLTNNLQLNGLAFDSTRDLLYGVRALAGQGGEGLYAVNTVDGTTTLLLEFEPSTASAYTFDGADYDAVTDRIYLADDDDTDGRGIYSIDPANIAAGLAFVVAYPPNVTDVDGVAAGDGKVVLISDSLDTPSTASIEGNGGLHYVYDIAGGTFTTIATPHPERSPLTPTSTLLGNPTAGGAWVPNFRTPNCRADFNGSGGVTVQDIFDFLAAYFGNDPRADINDSGDVTVQDIFDYLSAYFTGCP
jgi:hypothetical protein